LICFNAEVYDSLVYLCTKTSATKCHKTFEKCLKDVTQGHQCPNFQPNSKETEELGKGGTWKLEYLVYLLVSCGYLIGVFNELVNSKEISNYS